MTAPELAVRVKKSRGTFTCPRCRRPVAVGTQIGLITGVGWCHVTPCIIGEPKPSTEGKRP